MTDCVSVRIYLGEKYDEILRELNVVVPDCYIAMIQEDWANI